MKLPQIDAYTFSVKSPSSGLDITMRPYLVREEKLLIMAQEAKNYDDQAEAVAQIIRNCTNDIVEPRLAPYFDIEFYLLQLRNRSVGDIVAPVFECQNIVNDAKCGSKHTEKINLSTITVSQSDKPHTNLITLSDRYQLKLKYPTVFTVTKMFESTINAGATSGVNAVNSLIDLFDTLEDTIEKTVFQFSDYNDADKTEFLESLRLADREKLVEFLETMPALRHTTTYECEACKFQHTIKFEGLSDFLALPFVTTP